MPLSERLPRISQLGRWAVSLVFASSPAASQNTDPFVIAMSRIAKIDHFRYSLSKGVHSVQIEDTACLGPIV